MEKLIESFQKTSLKKSISTKCNNLYIFNKQDNICNNNKKYNILQPQQNDMIFSQLPYLYRQKPPIQQQASMGVKTILIQPIAIPH